MKRWVAALLVLTISEVSGPVGLRGYGQAFPISPPSRGLSADLFLDRVSAHPVGDQMEETQFAELYMALNSDQPAEVQKVIPAVLRYAHTGNLEQVRAYALTFLLSIAGRPDGANLLSSKSEQIASLISDDNAMIQASVVSTAEILMMQPATNNKPYVAALTAAVLNKRTPQDVVAERMIHFLMIYGRSDPAAVNSILAFLHRDDLTSSTRSDLLRELSAVPGLPEKVKQYLIERLDDPAPSVRAAAVIAFADDHGEFHSLAKSRVEKIAGDPIENPGLRELAKKALAGQSFAWDPDAYVTPVDPTPH
jgi:hypothetical protein